MLRLFTYDRRAAVAYAHKWAFGRNPAFLDFSELGGDCTNFASQCLYAGTGIMNFTPEFGWYYIDPDNRAPAWTGVPFFWDFMTRNTVSDGPFGLGATMNVLRPGDFVQIRFKTSGEVFAHTPVVVSVGDPPMLDNILVAAHSNDADNRPLSTYENVEEMRFLHILGAALLVGDEEIE
ncbi:MAG: amidase domain-containing protein [Oscillospiraceae bacterium]|nr:amidase domain-containing protein [Oscillospiraceae bacterium]